MEQAIPIATKRLFVHQFDILEFIKFKCLLQIFKHGIEEVKLGMFF